MTGAGRGFLAFFIYSMAAMLLFPATGNELMAERTDHYLIDLKSIQNCWPTGHQPPKALSDLAVLAGGWSNPSMGYFELKGSRFDDYWIELGGELSEQFGKFLSLPDGSYVALWFHDGATPNAEPVILIGSEGELRVLAPNLKAFLQKWAAGISETELDLEPENDTAEMVAARIPATRQLQELIASLPDHPAGAPVGNLPQFMEQWQEQAIKRLAADRTLQAIAKLLDAHVPRGKEPWESSFMHLCVAGGRVEIQTGALPPDYKTFVPLPERDALIPLILKAREERANLHPGRGLWNSASLEIYANGLAMIKASWEFEPEFREGGRMTRAELAEGLKRFPREPRWMQPWMNELE
jgi:hypothetical protein